MTFFELNIDALVHAARADQQPSRLFSAAEAIAEQVIGFRLFTIMLFDSQRFEVQRLHSSMPAVYPLGGRKKKAATPWGEHVLMQRKVYRAERFDEILMMFDDHETLRSLNIGSMLNIPIAYDGKCIGTMNLSHEEGWFTPDHERLGLLIGAFLVAPLMQLQQQSDCDLTKK
ncbi:GAF domain-containing protein [Noviherbaspirillum aerium]|uniref:GAF domain-containing protein n=1 Tax=Noviherbaspirillum aerium TaxID=2588497 RepID=UPI00124C36A8|nr:GAF domain-containing protein [Noviherbaspirillum aerium]